MWNSVIARTAGAKSWARASDEERARRIANLRAHDRDGSRSRGGRKGGAATAAYYRSLPPAAKTAKLIQILFAEAVARARKQGHVDPQFLVPYQPRPIAHPSGRKPKRNKSRDKRRRERALEQAYLQSQLEDRWRC
jgi:hypothetical protein